MSFISLTCHLNDYNSLCECNGRHWNEFCVVITLILFLYIFHCLFVYILISNHVNGGSWSYFRRLNMNSTCNEFTSLLHLLLMFENLPKSGKFTRLLHFLLIFENLPKSGKFTRLLHLLYIWKPAKKWCDH